MRLREIKKLEGAITLQSGLHIGAGDTTMHIGGTDSPVVKHPHTLEPYIPGSSLKGKVRALLEMASGLMVLTKGAPLSMKTLEKVKNDPKSYGDGLAIVRTFGSSGDDTDEEGICGPTRISFADCFLDQEWKQMAQMNRWLYTEEKSENVINRIKGTAEHPRTIERVPAGAVFRFAVTFKLLFDDDEHLFDDVVLRGIKLLELDTVGGNGSRGYGRIAIKLDDAALDAKFRTLNPF